MDRDDHALSLLSPASTGKLTHAVPFDSAFTHLPADVRSEVLVKSLLMRRIAASRKVLPTCRQIAAEMEGKRGFSAETLSDDFYRYQQHGAAALIDHRKCGTKANSGACGVIGCTRAKHAGLSQELVEAYWSRVHTNDKRGLREGWERLITQLISGEPIVSGVTWQTLHFDLFPGQPLPSRCPWSVSHPPPGWSQSNFQRHKLAKQIAKALKKGGSAAWNEMPDVRMDLNALRFLEAVVFDDHRLDFEVMVWDERGRVQIVELWGLFAMDIATGAVISFGLRPKLQREDGTTEGLTMRDMQHLIAHILATYGFPTRWKMTCIVENAAAAVSQHTEQLLLTRSHGQVVIRRTGVHAGDYLVRGFPERWGAPRGKAVLETWFNLLDIALGDVKGQMGSNYTVKPGDHDGRVRIAEKLAHVITARPELAAKLSAPLHWSGDAHLLVTEAIKAINERTDHAMRRHEQIIEFRWSERDITPKPLRLVDGLPAGLQREVQEFLNLPSTARETLLNNYGTTRVESPAEKVRRIHRSADFAQIPADTFLDLMMDAAKAVYKGGNVLDVEVRQGKRKQLLRFVGECHHLAIGDEVRVRFNSDRPSAGIWVHDEREVFLAYLRFERDPRMLNDEDLPLLQAQLGAKNRAFSQTLTEAARIARKLPSHAAEEAARDRDISVLKTLSLEAPQTVAPALAESADLARVVLSTKRREKVAEPSDADLYLEAIGDDD